MQLISGAILVLFLNGFVFGQNIPSDFDDAWNRLVTKHRSNLEDEGIVGATFAFVHNGEIIAVDYYGMEDLATDRPVDEHTIYHWASITKTFTGVAIMQLRNHDLLELNDPIVKYIPELRRVYNPYGSMKEITNRQLMSHSSGFRGPTWPWGGDKSWHPHEPTKWPQLVAMFPYTRIHFEPGSKFSYSNPGIIFLGRTIEQQTGSEYESYIDGNIFDLLGMDDAYFDTTPWHLLDNRSNNYRIVNGEPVANGLDFNTGITVSNGGLNTTVNEMAKWMGFLMGAPKERQPIYEKVLEPGSLDEMFEPVISIADSSGLGEVAMGLTFFLYQHNGHQLVGHTGGQKSFSTFIFFDPKSDVGIIGAYNTTGGDKTAPEIDKIINRVRVAGLEKFFPLFRDEE